ncbi:MAG TPA: YIP1 family protein [Bacteroidota bacterium]|jgi:hypothetical protein|nr:YIP1 family protein [Bacteroidota bacterium]
MITCAVCQTQNNHLAIVCSQCGGFLQTRADTLDLFSTIWGIMERPSKAFHKIAVAKHKNYAYIVSSVAGIGFAFLIFWLLNAADYSDSLVNILGAGLLAGPVFGLAAIPLFALFLKLTMRAFRMTVAFRSVLAVSAYAFIPQVISVFLILPVKLMTFGTFYFSGNPSPWSLKPSSYALLLGLDALCAGWSFLLLAIGVKTLIGGAWVRAMSVLAIPLVLIVIVITVILRQTLHP